MKSVEIAKILLSEVNNQPHGREVLINLEKYNHLVTICDGIDALVKDDYGAAAGEPIGLDIDLCIEEQSIILTLSFHVLELQKVEYDKIGFISLCDAIRVYKVPDEDLFSIQFVVNGLWG